MLRKLILGAGIGLGGLIPLATPAEAHEIVYVHSHHHRFEVIYRRCDRDPWTCYGRYSYREDARHAAHRLRERGFEARVR
jgi:hypothetical protein